MSAARKPFLILMADDDVEDCMLAREALKESRLSNPIDFVHDGVALMQYLRGEGVYQNAQRPGIILLDLNMPRKNGHEALQEIREDPNLKTIPVIILTTSQSEIDIQRSYEIGANSYITKPVGFHSLVDVMMTLGHYWFEIVEL